MILTEDDENLEIYPFRFELKIQYKLISNCLIVRYLVKNNEEDKSMYFAIGAHPGFNLPLDQQTNFNDYYLEFSPKQSRMFIPVTEEVLLQTDSAIKLSDSIYLIDRELFSEGVLINSEPVSKQAFAHAFATVNVPFTEDMYQKILGRSLKDIQHFFSKYYQDAQLAQKIIEIREYEFAQHYKLYPVDVKAGVFDLLDFLDSQDLKKSDSHHCEEKHCRRTA